jgi:DNA-binding Lrp family transcriptional regulator
MIFVMAGTPTPLDRIDRQLLRLLSNDARTSNKELAAAVGLAPSSCHVRLQRLLADGWLQGFHARVRPEAFGIGMRAIVFVRIARHTAALLDAFRGHVRRLPEVLDVFYVAGSHDFLVHVAVRDVEHLRRLVAERLSTHEAIGHVETSLVFEHHQRPQWPDYAEPEAPRKEPSSRSTASRSARKRREPGGGRGSPPRGC